MRHIIHDRGRRHWQQAVTNAHFLLRIDHHEAVRLIRRLAGALQFQGAEVGRFVTDHFLGDRVLQWRAGTEGLERGAVLQVAGDVGFFALADVHMTFLCRHDMRRACQLVVFDDQGLDQEGFNRAGRDRGHRVLAGACDPHLRRQPAAVGAAGRLAEPQAAGDAIEVDDLARIDPVRIVDFFAIHVPDLGPAPWMHQKFSGDIPQRIALHHGMLIRRVGQEGAGAGSGLRGGRSQAAKRGGKSEN